MSGNRRKEAGVGGRAPLVVAELLHLVGAVDSYP